MVKVSHPIDTCYACHNNGDKMEIKSLTGIRGLFAVYVMFFHINPFASTSTLLSNGYIAVDLFFILSGFILTYVYNERFLTPISSKEYILYLLNRFNRIYPLYFMILSIVVIYYFTKNNYPTLIYDVTSNYLFIQSVTGNGFIGPAWSLSTEVIAYLFIPIMIFYFQRNKALLYICVYFSVCSLGYIAYSIGRVDVFSGWQAIVRCISEYTLGIFSFFIFKSMENKKNNSFCLIMSILVFLMLCNRGFDLFVIISFMILIPAIASSSGLVSKALSIWPVYYIGELSYSIYLWHGVISRQFQGEFTSLSEWFGFENHLLFMVLATLSLSIITYHFIEIPCKNALKKRALTLIAS